MIHREQMKSEKSRSVSEHLQRCHVIEGMVQLLTNGLVLQLLSIQFIWRSEVDSKYRRGVEDGSDTQTHTHKPKKSRTKTRDSRRQRAEGGRRRQKKRENRSAFLKMQKCLEERMMHSPTCLEPLPRESFVHGNPFRTLIKNK